MGKGYDWAKGSVCPREAWINNDGLDFYIQNKELMMVAPFLRDGLAINSSEPPDAFGIKEELK